MKLGIDFGLSNTDFIIIREDSTEHHVERYSGPASPELIKRMFRQKEILTTECNFIGVTGGRHRDLPDEIDGVPIYKINEVEAIGRGGQSLLDPPDSTALVVSAGSGTAMISALNDSYAHAGGSAVGGGTLLGLGRLLLNSIEPFEIDRLAETGDRNKADLAMADVISGPIGSIGPDATAVNFGRLSRDTPPPSREDLAASLVTMIGQTISLIAINVAATRQLSTIIVIGHLTDLPTIRQSIAAVGDLYNQPFIIPGNTGHTIALGACLAAEKLHAAK